MDCLVFRGQNIFIAIKRRRLRKPDLGYATKRVSEIAAKAEVIGNQNDRVLIGLLDY